MPRCSWAGDDPLYIEYHDTEWGFPVDDDRRLFEKICLEGFQSGLSWITILRKRENFRRAFRDFDLDKVARFGDRDVERLLQDAGIIRHRGKIVSTINNAKRARELKREYGSLGAYFWSWSDAKELARDLKSRGWTFVGPTTVYAFMQAMGIVNDHAADCEWRDLTERARKKFRKPQRAAAPAAESSSSRPRASNRK
jgi:DNA-3-methyladenine glycosylase I